MKNDCEKEQRRASGIHERKACLKAKDILHRCSFGISALATCTPKPNKAILAENVWQTIWFLCTCMSCKAIWMHYSPYTARNICPTTIPTMCSIVLGYNTFNHMISPSLSHWCTLNHLSRWTGKDADWCTLAEASLSVEVTKSLLHLVNTISTCTDMHYFGSVEEP